MNMKSVFRHYLNPKDDQELEDFCLWALGSNYERLHNGMDVLKAWNTIHGELLMLQVGGLIIDDIPKIIELWRSIHAQD